MAERERRRILREAWIRERNLARREAADAALARLQTAEDYWDEPSLGESARSFKRSQALDDALSEDPARAAAAERALSEYRTLLGSASRPVVESAMGPELATRLTGRASGARPLPLEARDDGSYQQYWDAPRGGLLGFLGRRIGLDPRRREEGAVFDKAEADARANAFLNSIRAESPASTAAHLERNRALGRVLEDRQRRGIQLDAALDANSSEEALRRELTSQALARRNQSVEDPHLDAIDARLDSLLDGVTRERQGIDARSLIEALFGSPETEAEAEAQAEAEEELLMPERTPTPEPVSSRLMRGPFEMEPGSSVVGGIPDFRQLQRPDAESPLDDVPGRPSWRRTSDGPNIQIGLAQRRASEPETPVETPASGRTIAERRAASERTQPIEPSPQEAAAPDLPETEPDDLERRPPEPRTPAAQEAVVQLQVANEPEQIDQAAENAASLMLSGDLQPRDLDSEALNKIVASMVAVEPDPYKQIVMREKLYEMAGLAPPPSRLDRYNARTQRMHAVAGLLSPEPPTRLERMQTQSGRMHAIANLMNAAKGVADARRGGSDSDRGKEIRKNLDRYSEELFETMVGDQSQHRRKLAAKRYYDKIVDLGLPASGPDADPDTLFATNMIVANAFLDEPNWFNPLNWSVLGDLSRWAAGSTEDLVYSSGSLIDRIMGRVRFRDGKPYVHKYYLRMVPGEKDVAWEAPTDAQLSAWLPPKMMKQLRKEIIENPERQR